ncbi:MAG: hypothetical protein CVU49_08660 [Candidatus Cloacimonetes bacterium HGW-Cloacimonetes-2]|nr:MAG: hypothetical protein CVU49_08660 [Candidatus Cloacimonetes bacterium HGW-Cloacimonetes-2]
MKRYIYLAMLAGLALLLASCWPTEPEYPRPEPWLCSINADGTGFRKIKKSPFNTPGLVDIYMTKDNRIIFYGEKLWISETDTIRIEQITPENLVLFDAPKLEFTRDGGTAYFAASRDLYKLKLSTNEVFKITETPADYYWAEPMLSDDELYVTMRGYWGKGDTPQTVYSYIDLTDNSLHNVYATNYVAAPYKGKITGGFSKFVLENKHGLGSISFIDSTFTLHLSYSASYKNMFETSTDQCYLITKYVQSAKSYAIAIDLQNYARYNLGYVNEQFSRSPIKICKDANLVFYFDDQQIYRYDLDTHQKSIVIGSNAGIDVYSIIMLAPTWDGSKLYFYADIVVR